MCVVGWGGSASGMVLRGCHGYRKEGLAQLHSSSELGIVPRSSLAWCVCLCWWKPGPAGDGVEPWIRPEDAIFHFCLAQ